MQIKCPSSDPSFRERFNCSLEEIIFKAPSAVGFYFYMCMFPEAAQTFLVFVFFLFALLAESAEQV